MGQIGTNWDKMGEIGTNWNKIIELFGNVGGISGNKLEEAWSDSTTEMSRERPRDRRSTYQMWFKSCFGARESGYISTDRGTGIHGRRAGRFEHQEEGVDQPHPTSVATCGQTLARRLPPRRNLKNSGGDRRHPCQLAYFLLGRPCPACSSVIDDDRTACRHSNRIAPLPDDMAPSFVHVNPR